VTARANERRGAGVPGAKPIHALLAAALGAAAALLVACSGSAGGLIPSGNAGPLRGDFEAVARAAESGNGKCSETESALSKTELDFAALPSSVNAELRSTLSQGIANLKVRALALCSQPMPQTNTTPTTTTPTTATTTPTTPTTSSTTNTTPPPTTTPTTTNPGGGTPPEESKGAGAGGEHAGGEEAGKVETPEAGK
jgi:hypothetical protein